MFIFHDNNFIHFSDLYHLKDIKEDKKIIMRQTHLENYFKKVKELLNE